MNDIVIFHQLFYVNAVDRSRTQHFFAANLDILALNQLN